MGKGRRPRSCEQPLSCSAGAKGLLVLGYRDVEDVSNEDLKVIQPGADVSIYHLIIHLPVDMHQLVPVRLLGRMPASLRTKKESLLSLGAATLRRQ